MLSFRFELADQILSRVRDAMRHKKTDERVAKRGDGAVRACSEQKESKEISRTASRALDTRESRRLGGCVAGAPGAAHPPYETILFCVPHAVHQKLEEEACNVATDKKTDDGPGANNPLKKAAVRKEEKCVVKQMAEVCMDESGRNHIPPTSIAHFKPRPVSHRVPAIKRQRTQGLGHSHSSHQQKQTAYSGEILQRTAAMRLHLPRKCAAQMCRANVPRKCAAQMCRGAERRRLFSCGCPPPPPPAASTATAFRF